MAATTGPAARAGRFPALAKYDVIEEIGHGGMATVYRAHDPRLGRDVAIKVIHPHLRDSLEAKTRFHVEAKAVAKLRHANIVEVFDVSSEGEPEQYLVVELVRGATLRKLLQDLKEHGAVPPEVAASLAVEILAALAHAHAAGVVHRDIKPENVMIEHRPRETGGEPGDHVAVKLTDFGIAKLLDAQGVTSTGQVLGSPAHMAPEQIEGADVDARADVFGLGVLLYECMVGHLPFEGNNPAQVLRRVLEGIYPSAERERPTVGKRWSALLDRALARSPDDRFPDATAMRDALIAELRLMGVASPRAALEGWLDDPEGHARTHDEALITRLCTLGREARGRGAALDAAAHFNRALAYAPHDPALMKIVASMHRSQAWRRVVVRVVPVVLVSVSLGAAAFFVTRAIRSRIATPSSSVAATSTATSVPSAAPLPSSPPARASASATSRTPPAHSTIPIPRPVVKRTIALTSVRPANGVLVALDGEALGEATQGLALPVDDKAHELRFTCRNDECEPLVRAIAQGQDPVVSLDVALALKPATLIVDGDPLLSYGIVELPSMSVVPGAPVVVRLPRAGYIITVAERPSGKSKHVLLGPGKQVHVDFLSAE